MKTLPWKTKFARSILVMEDLISRLLHHCCVDVLQEGWPSWKTDLFYRY